MAYYHALRHDLKGPPIEPQAAHWTFAGERIHVVDVHEDHSPALPVPYDTDPSLLENEVQELAHLADPARRIDPNEIAGSFTAVKPTGKPYGIEDTVNRERRKLSLFFRLRPPPLTAQFNLEARGAPAPTNVLEPCVVTGDPIVRNGQELARFFEDETPGLMHRHALNCLLWRRSVSPPRQARIWMALDVAIYSALLAAWHIKWGHRDVPKDSDPPDYTRSYRERPYVWEERVAKSEDRLVRFKVLFDNRLGPEGQETTTPYCTDLFSPGTPRHPAYPSGHSTYSAAASQVLAYFFPDAEEHLSDLSDNIGMARLWSGVHWRQDHTAGVAIGTWVAKKVIAQLCRDPVEKLVPAPDRCDATFMTPAFETVELIKKFRTAHGGGNCVDGQDTIPLPEQDPARFQGQRGGVAS